MKWIAVLSAFAITGCAAFGEAIQGPSGAIIHEAKCNMSPNACFKKAAMDCKGPYQVLGSSSNAGGVAADILPGPVTWYRMSYQCGRSDGVMPTFPFRGQQYIPTTTTTCNRFGNTVTCNSF